MRLGCGRGFLGNWWFEASRARLFFFFLRPTDKRRYVYVVSAIVEWSIGISKWRGLGVVRLWAARYIGSGIGKHWAFPKCTRYVNPNKFPFFVISIPLTFPFLMLCVCFFLIDGSKQELGFWCWIPPTFNNSPWRTTHDLRRNRQISGHVIISPSPFCVDPGSTMTSGQFRF